jgi:hypothetical protein
MFAIRYGKMLFKGKWIWDYIFSSKHHKINQNIQPFEIWLWFCDGCRQKQNFGLFIPTLNSNFLHFRRLKMIFQK